MTDFSLFGRDLFGEAIKPKASGVLARKFTVPPFSVLNARDGAWQDRKRAWISLGIKSEVGRGENLTKLSEEARSGNLDHYRAGKRGGLLGISEQARKLAGGYDEDDGEMKQTSGTSVFDPVLAELAYSWFCPPKGTILDPFAGGSVRGVVASLLGYQYTGIDLRAEQIEANREQAKAICSEPLPAWIEGDSRGLGSIEVPPADFVFSCPPYADLERYSDDPRDLSTLDYPAFREAYRDIIAASVSKLKQGRFACFVVGDIRDPAGIYRNFTGDTISAFEAAGARYYNEAILVTVCGSLPIRVGKQFAAGRKLGKTHQNVLVFCKGDPRAAADACEGRA